MVDQLYAIEEPRDVDLSCIVLNPSRPGDAPA